MYRRIRRWARKSAAIREARVACTAQFLSTPVGYEHEKAFLTQKFDLIANSDQVRVQFASAPWSYTWLGRSAA
jgi:hypothetical protein